MARFFALLVLMFVASTLHATEIDWGGFLAFDLMRVTKQDDRRQDNVTGIGSLDLKLTAKKDRTTFRLKLDLDDSNIGKPYKIFEEARLSYRFNPNWQFSVGKGTARFQRMHWGGINASYFDNGTAIGGFHWNFTDQDNRLLVSLEQGSRQAGLQQTLSFYGEEALTLDKGADGRVKTDPASGKPLVVTNSKEWDVSDQRGGVYRLDLTLAEGWEASAAVLGYWHRFNPHVNYAFDAGLEYKDALWNLWAEALWGRSSSFLYSYKDRVETLAQLGAEYLVLPVLGLIVDMETATFDYVSTSGPLPANVNGTMSKVELAARYELQPMTYWTNGVMLERQDLEGKEPVWARQFLSSFSHWF